MKQKTIVILLSNKRSGSTMFQDELCKHPQIQTVTYSPHTYLETHHWLKSAVMLGMARETFAGRMVYPGYGSPKNARTYLIDCVKGNVPDFHVPEDDRSLVFDGWEALCERYADPVFFEKSPQILPHWAALSLLLEWMQRTQYKVKIIGLTRNPLSVQYSAHELFHTDPEKRQYQWLETQKNLLAFRNLIPADDFYFVKYEDIIKNPQKTFTRICEFIEVEAFPAMGEKVHSESLTKWRDDPYFTLQLDEPVKQIALGFGYTEAELENPIKLAPSLVSRLEKKWKGKYKLGLARLKNRLIKPLLIRMGWDFSKYD